MFQRPRARCKLPHRAQAPPREGRVARCARPWRSVRDGGEWARAPHGAAANASPRPARRRSARRARGSTLSPRPRARPSAQRRGRRRRRRPLTPRGSSGRAPDPHLGKDHLHIALAQRRAPIARRSIRMAARSAAASPSAARPRRHAGGHGASSSPLPRRAPNPRCDARWRLLCQRRPLRGHRGAAVPLIQARRLRGAGRWNPSRPSHAWVIRIWRARASRRR